MALAAAGRAALAAIVPRQLAAGIDIPNNGEQQRDSFVLYLRDRMTGLGGSWQRRQRADLERYPMFLQQLREAMTTRQAVDDIGGLPKAIGPIGYPDARAIEAECSDFPRRARRAAEPCRRRLSDRAVARHGLGDRAQ